MEPIAYIISLFYSILAYAYFLAARHAFDLQPMQVREGLRAGGRETSGPQPRGPCSLASTHSSIAPCHVSPCP